MRHEAKRARRRHLAKRTVSMLWLASAAALALTILLPTALGLQRYVIVGESMTGFIAKGSVVYAQPVPVAQLGVGDVVTFVPPGFSEPVTHRILRITPGADGRPVFETKGDYNEVADPWRLTFVQDSVARYVFHVPYLGYALAALSIREVRMLAVGLPAILIALSLLWSTWHSAGAELRRREAERATFAPALYVAEEESAS